MLTVNFLTADESRPLPYCNRTHWRQKSSIHCPEPQPNWRLLSCKGKKLCMRSENDMNDGQEEELLHCWRAEIENTLEGIWRKQIIWINYTWDEEGHEQAL
mmetsp:Transcript_26537/g.46800  ORF Transcript_26537/g.46800 Transcript_26537/m.46800 type:complete len:101 (-) Transcript_26537:1260-1562(-)